MRERKRTGRGEEMGVEGGERKQGRNSSHWAKRPMVESHKNWKVPEGALCRGWSKELK